MTLSGEEIVISINPEIYIAKMLKDWWNNKGKFLNTEITTVGMDFGMSKLILN